MSSHRWEPRTIIRQRRIATEENPKRCVYEAGGMTRPGFSNCIPLCRPCGAKGKQTKKKVGRIWWKRHLDALRRNGVFNGSGTDNHIKEIGGRRSMCVSGQQRCA